MCVPNHKFSNSIFRIQGSNTGEILGDCSDLASFIFCFSIFLMVTSIRNLCQCATDFDQYSVLLYIIARISFSKNVYVGIYHGIDGDHRNIHNASNGKAIREPNNIFARPIQRDSHYFCFHNKTVIFYDYAYYFTRKRDWKN